MVETNEQTRYPESEEQILAAAKHAQAAGRILAAATGEQRALVLTYAQQELQRCQTSILEANRADLAEAKTLLEEKQISASLMSRLKLDQDKLQAIGEGLKQVAALPEPLGQSTLDRELDHGLELQRITCPIGLIAVIFESRPDALPQIASLCLKSGNAAILKGGKEANRTNRAIFACLRKALQRAALPDDCLVLMETREAIDLLLKADRYVDLIIPRGSSDLVRYIQSNTRIPVLGHADGLCHIYVDEDAALEKAQRIIIDAKVQYPAACNSMETLLVHEKIAPALLVTLLPALLAHKVELRMEQQVLPLLSEPLKAQMVIAREEDWSTEYSDLILSIKVVPSLEAAIEHINFYGSHHTEAIVSTSAEKFEQFSAQVNSASIFWNASTRFADGFRYGFGAEVGISTGKLHPRGPVGLEGLVTYKYKLSGDGHIVADYVGESAKAFTHRNIDKVRL